MSDSCECLGCNIGGKVPDFKLDTYDPVKGDFSSISLAGQKRKKKWTILFFYPADFTFV
jgi:peroxiredoxin (alkyl hydroperoxide reductase subunit C)